MTTRWTFAAEAGGCQAKGGSPASNALACANMALAGYDPVIRLDEVLDTAQRVCLPLTMRASSSNAALSPRHPLTTRMQTKPKTTLPMKLECSEVKKTASKLKFRAKASIDGKFVNAKTGKTYVSINPATGQPLTQIASCDPRLLNPHRYQ